MIDCSTITLTTIAENTSAGGGVLGKWGLSVLIQAGETRLLLDTGAGPSTAHNARTMGVDLASLDTIVLSHGHGDHTGGLEAVLEAAGDRAVRVIAHPAALEPKYSVDTETGVTGYIGIPFRTEYLEGLGARFELTRKPTFLSEDVAAGGEEPMTTSFERVASNLQIREGDAYVQDPMADDQSIYIRSDRGLVIVLGCAHRGMINIIRHAREIMGAEDVYLVIGGTHLSRASDEQVDRTIRALDELGVQHLGVSHCTGLAVAAGLKAHFGDRFFFNNAGTRISLPL